MNIDVVYVLYLSNCELSVTAIYIPRLFLKTVDNEQAIASLLSLQACKI